MRLAFSSAAKWMVLGLCLALFLQVWDSSHVQRVSDVSALHSLVSLPQRVIISGQIKNPHHSSNALVFELQNNGRITCYWRRVPENTFLFADENVTLRARIESTPTGKWCVIEKLEEAGGSS